MPVTKTRSFAVIEGQCDTLVEICNYEASYLKTLANRRMTSFKYTQGNRNCSCSIGHNITS